MIAVFFKSRVCGDSCELPDSSPFELVRDGERYQRKFTRGDGVVEYHHVGPLVRVRGEPSLEIAVSMLHNFDLQPVNAELAKRPVNLILRRIDNRRGAVDFLIMASGVCWWINDNGGEWNLERVNLDPLPTSIPTSWHGLPLNEATMAARVAMVLRGERIDYEERLTDSDQDVLMEHRRPA